METAFCERRNDIRFPRGYLHLWRADSKNKKEFPVNLLQLFKSLLGKLWRVTLWRAVVVGTMVLVLTLEGYDRYPSTAWLIMIPVAWLIATVWLAYYQAKHLPPIETIPVIDYGSHPTTPTRELWRQADERKAQASRRSACA